MKTAVITGSAGQDGTYLSDHLRKLGYRVIGLARSPASVDITESDQVQDFLRETRPDEIYHLAAYHHSSQDKLTNDFEVFQNSNAVHVNATANLLEGIAQVCPSARFFFAASCHIFGVPPTPLQDENTPLNPNGLYGITKQAGLHLCHYYRGKHRVFAAVGILYNHESPLRSVRFVSKKIVTAAVAIAQRRQDKLVLGDLDAEIDWGYAGDYVEAMQRVLQLPVAEDFVISSGAKHSVREFVGTAFGLVGLDWERHVVVDPNLLRQPKRMSLFGNNAKLQRLTGWKPTTSFSELVRLMVTTEQARA